MLVSLVQLSATPWTVTHQASLSMGFPRQEYWSGLPFPSPDSGTEPVSPAPGEEVISPDLGAPYSGEEAPLLHRLSHSE